MFTQSQELNDRENVNETKNDLTERLPLMDWMKYMNISIDETDWSACRFLFDFVMIISLLDHSENKKNNENYFNKISD